MQRLFTLVLVSFLAVGLSNWSAKSASGQDEHGQTERSRWFSVPGHEREMNTLGNLFELHREAAFSTCTLWDGWLPHATLWTGQSPRDRYRNSLLNKRIDTNGYVSMQQHRGMAHSEGWPFPAWQQSTGKGWHFSTRGESWAIQNFKLTPLTSTDGWEIDGGTAEGINEDRGLMLQIQQPVFTLTTPPFRCGTIAAPFVRLEWAASDLPKSASATIQWRLDGQADWQGNDAVAIELPPPNSAHQYANVPLYLQPAYHGLVTQYRIIIRDAVGARVDLQSLITAIDTRHPITNALFVRASCEYFAWTKDREFLAANLPRMRQAMRYAIDEFRVEQNLHVVVPWVGHDGQSGLVKTADGKNQLRPGVGVGNNYWDLLPFGGHDAIATMYLVDAMDWLANLEETIAKHPEWQLLAPSNSLTSAESLRELAEKVRTDFQSRFWDQDKQRFVGWIDATGKAHDCGFTFVNLEAIHYGMARSTQAESILQWLDGKRLIDGDTSQGADIYHWRFAPRATTKRNVETYVWAWSNPASIPWGGQVQDGGAVLGFSYFDLMARLKTHGPDDAWKRLEQIISWFDEIEQAGGYRNYYSVPGRGTLQGGGPAGGLGMDREFMESVLVPQIMLYGFLGFQPTADSFKVQPNLPKGWPSLTVHRVHIHDRVVDITAMANGDVTVVDVP